MVALQDVVGELLEDQLAGGVAGVVAGDLREDRAEGGGQLDERVVLLTETWGGQQPGEKDG